MSRHESDREDLLREATALVTRIELSIPALQSEPIVIGFRSNGCASFFCGVDPVFQFNSAGELRRIYHAGELMKAEKGRLIALRRERSETETALIRRELTSDEQQSLLQKLAGIANAIKAALAAGTFEINGQVPASENVLQRVQVWLAENPPIWPVAQAPNAR